MSRSPWVPPVKRVVQPSHNRSLKSQKTYKMPLQRVHTNEPTVMFTYVGPLCSQSKHFLLSGFDPSSRRSLRCLSSCFRLAAMLDGAGRSIYELTWTLVAPHTRERVNKVSGWIVIVPLILRQSVCDV